MCAKTTIYLIRALSGTGSKQFKNVNGKYVTYILTTLVKRDLKYRRKFGWQNALMDHLPSTIFVERSANIPLLAQLKARSWSLMECGYQLVNQVLSDA